MSRGHVRYEKLDLHDWNDIAPVECDGTRNELLIGLQALPHEGYKPDIEDTSNSGV
jgi:hypothetical protein